MYYLFIFVFLLFGAILPSVYLLIIQESTSTWDQMVTTDSMPEGLAYTLCGSVIFAVLALMHRPNVKVVLRSDQTLSPRVIQVCWYLGVVSQLISILLNLRYGMSQSGLTAQRPYFAVLLAYFAMVAGTAGAGFFFHELRFVGFTGRLLFYLFLQSAALATAWSRSALVLLGCLTVLALAYSQKVRRIRLPSFRSLVIGGVLAVATVVAVFYGQSMRGGTTSIRPFLAEGMQRVFANQVALFIAIDRFADVNRILLENEPWVLVDQMVSFVRPRTLYPSSMRFVELSGGVVAPDERGHVSGYAFGWLGLTYGVADFKWGLVLLAIILWVHFKVLWACFRRPRSLFALLIFSVFAGSMFEFLGNLGIDSFGEKLFKNLLYAIFAYLTVKAIQGVAKRPPPAPAHSAGNSAPSTSGRS